jgi:hypothetical protein
MIGGAFCVAWFFLFFKWLLVKQKMVVVFDFAKCFVVELCEVCLGSGMLVLARLIVTLR